MSTRTVMAAGTAWSFSPDDPPPLAARTQALLRATIVDEVTGQPAGVALSARTTLAGATARVAGSLAGIIGQPRTHFPDAGIAAARARMEVLADGYLPLVLEAAMGPQPGYPNAFVAPDLGQVALHRRPVRIAGQVVSRAAGPLAGVTVELLRLWPLLGAIGGAGDAPDCLCLFAGLRADRGAGATLRRRNLALAAETKRLLRPAVAGDTQVWLSDRVAIAVGQILTIDPGDEERVEHIGIAAIEGATTDDQPALVTLDLPLQRAHAARLVAARGVAAGAGAANLLARPARAGDVTVFSPQAGIGPATTAVEISGGGPAVSEYHAAARYRAQTDPAGDYMLPPIHRAAHLRLRAGQPGPPAPILHTVTPGFNQPALTLDFVFP